MNAILNTEGKLILRSDKSLKEQLTENEQRRFPFQSQEETVYSRDGTVHTLTYNARVHQY